MNQLLARSTEFVRSFQFNRGWFERNRPILVKIGVLATLFFSVLYVIPRVLNGVHTIPRLFLAGIFALTAVVIILRFPWLSLLGLLPAAMVVPFGIGTGTGTELNAGILLALAAIGLWVLEMVVVERRLSVFHSRTVRPLLLLCLTVLLALGVGQLPWFNAQHASISAQIGGAMIFLIAAGVFLVTANRLTERLLSWTLWPFIALGGLYVVLRAIPERFQYLVYRFEQFYEHGTTGSLFWVWLACLIVGQLFFNRRLALKYKAIMGVVLLCEAYVAFIQAQTWISGWMPALFGVAFMVFLQFKKLRAPILMIAAVLIAVKWSSITGVIVNNENEYSLVTRLDAWKILLQIAAVEPILGVGPANYYFYTILFPIRGYAVQFNSHNNYIDLLAQTGIVGLGMFLWTMVETLLLGLRLRDAVPEGIQRGFVYGAIGGVVGTVVAGMFGDWVLPFVYNVGYAGFRASLIGWFFMGALVAVERFHSTATASTAVVKGS